MKDLKIDGVTFQAFIYAVLPGSQTPVLIMWIRVSDEHSYPPVSCSICGGPDEPHWIWRWHPEEREMPLWLKPYIDRANLIMQKNNQGDFNED